MRSSFLIISIPLLIASVASAQPANDSVDTVLRRWDKAMDEAQTFACKVKRVSKDALGEEEFRGWAAFAKAEQKAGPVHVRMDLTKATNKEVLEKYICTGGRWYEYVPASQVVRIHPLPDAKKGEGFLTFLFGMGADKAKARYDITPDKGEPDANYHILWFEPKNAEEKRSFLKARLCLYKSNHMPAQVAYVQGNGGTIIWNFTEPQLNQPIDAKHFQPELPKEWKYEQAPALPKKLP